MVGGSGGLRPLHGVVGPGGGGRGLGWIVGRVRDSPPLLLERLREGGWLGRAPKASGKSCDLERRTRAYSVSQGGRPDPVHDLRRKSSRNPSFVNS